MLKPHDNIALVYAERKMTFSQLINRVRRIASDWPVQPDSRVVIMGPNSPEWVSALYASWQNGAAAVPVDFMSTMEDVSHILGDCQPVLAFVSDENRELFQQAMDDSGIRPELVSLESLADLPDPGTAGELRQPSKDEIMEIIYTSGTTGKPKGVMLTWDNLLSNFEHVWHPDYDLYHPEDRFGAILPFHHSYPLQGALTAVLHGGATVVMVEKLEPEVIMRTIQENRVTHIPVVPRLLTLFHQRIMDRINASFVKRMVFAVGKAIPSMAFRKKLFSQAQQAFGGHLDYMSCGGARLDPRIVRDFQVLGFTILDGFGMTETGPLISNNPKRGVRVGSVGLPVANMTVRIEDGEVQVKGRNVMKGYYNLPEATAETIVDGWLKTGDLGEVDKDGYLYITGRKKDILVLSNGKKINPEELEQGLTTLSPLVAEAGVFQDGDRIHAVFRPDLTAARQAGVTNVEEAIRDTVVNRHNGSVPAYRKITAVTIVPDELPRTRLGKLRRFMLPELTTRTVPEVQVKESEPDSRVYREIKQYLSREKDTPVWPSADLEMDLGLDSMDRVSLQAWLEDRFGASPDDEQWSNLRTVQQLTDAMAVSVDSGVAGETMDDSDQAGGDLPRSSLFHRSMRLLSRMWLKLYFRVKVDGLEKLPDTPFILAPNHQSMLDALLATTWLPREKFRNTFFFAKYKHFRSGWRRFLARRSNVIRVDINKGLRHSVNKLGEALKSVHNLIIFPEGTRSRDGRIQACKKTFAQLSKEFKVPVVPVAIKGAFEAFPPNRWIPRPRRITVSFLEPVMPDPRDMQRILEEVEEAIRSRLQSEIPCGSTS